MSATPTISIDTRDPRAMCTLAWFGDARELIDAWRTLESRGVPCEVPHEEVIAERLLAYDLPPQLLRLLAAKGLPLPGPAPLPPVGLCIRVTRANLQRARALLGELHPPRPVVRISKRTQCPRCGMTALTPPDFHVWRILVAVICMPASLGHWLRLNWECPECEHTWRAPAPDNYPRDIRPGGFPIVSPRDPFGPRSR